MGGRPVTSARTCRYEVTLWTSGIQQLGWATQACPFTNEEGVGDTHDSYAYDGKRVRKWNEQQRAYGDTWRAGDTVGALLDLDARQVRQLAHFFCT